MHTLEDPYRRHVCIFDSYEIVHVTVVGMFMPYVRASFISNFKYSLLITIKINGKCIFWTVTIFIIQKKIP
jgi:hypothetical protein